VESIPFIEAMRQIMLDHKEDTLFVHVALLPFFDLLNESKTKPLQKSVRDLLSQGIQPDMLVCRSSKHPLPEVLSKVSSFTNVSKSNIFLSLDVPRKYNVVESFKNQEFDVQVLKRLGCFEKYSTLQFEKWENLFSLHDKIDTYPVLTLGFIRKYVANDDNYVSLIEALKQAAISSCVNLKINYIDAEDEDMIEKIKGCDCMLVPGGFGNRGVDGMIRAVQYARENNLPFLGICLGFQICMIEFCRNVLKLDKAHSTEMDPNTPHPVIFNLEKRFSNPQDLKSIVHVSSEGIRLGGLDLQLNGPVFKEAYGSDLIRERFRNKFIFNSDYIERVEKMGGVIAAYSLMNGVQTVEGFEYQQNHFHASTQYHPEFKSSAFKCHPLIQHFIKKSMELKLKKD